MTRMIRTPDGLRFPMPDDATDEQINQAIRDIQATRTKQQQQPAATAAAPTAPWDVPDPETGVPGGARAPGELERAAAAKAARPSLADMIMGGTYGAVTGLGEGAMSLAGLPVDLVNIAPMLLNALPGEQNIGPMSDYPWFGSEMFMDAHKGATSAISGLFGRDPPPDIPDDAPAYVAMPRRIAQDVGAAGLPWMGATAAAAKIGIQGARKLAQPIVAGPLTAIKTGMPAVDAVANTTANAARGAVRGARNFGRDFAGKMVESAAVNPGRFARTELGAALAAGTGAAVANQVVPRKERFGPLAELFGAAGGVGSVALLSKLASSGANIFRAATSQPGYIDDVVKERVVDLIAEASGLQKEVGRPVDTDELVNIIMSGDRVSQVVPGVRESLADVTRNPGIAALEYGRQSGPNAGMFARARGENAQAVSRAIEGNAPQATPGAFRSELDAARQQQLDAARQRTLAAQDRVSDASRSLSATMTGEARGADLRSALENASDAANDIVRRAWEPLNQSTARIDMSPLADRFGRMRDDLSVAEQRRFRPAEADIPAELAAGGQPGGPPPPQRVQEVTGIRSALTDAAREAASAGRSNEARIIRDHIGALDEYLDTAIPPQLRGQYEQARNLRRDVADRFERPQTAIAQTLQRREGQYAQPDSAVARKFVQDDQGRIADFEALMRETGNDTRVQGAIRDQILSDVGSRGLIDNPNALDEYLGRYGTIFSRFPTLRRELGSAAALRRELGAAQTAETATQRSLGTPDRPGTSATGKYLAYSDENASRAMRGVLNAKDPTAAVDELLNAVGNRPQAVEGARRAFWDVMQEQTRSSGVSTRDVTGQQPWRAVSLKNFLDDPKNRAVMERLWRDNPEHVDNVRIIADAIQGLDTRLSAKAPNTSGTAQSILPSAETLGSRLFAYRRGQVGAGYLVTSIAATIGRRAVGAARGAAIDRMLDQALLDPDAAKVLLGENNPANRAALRRYAKGWWGAEGSQIVDALDDEDDVDDDTVKTIMREPRRPPQGAERPAFGGPR